MPNELSQTSEELLQRLLDRQRDRWCQGDRVSVETILSEVSSSERKSITSDWILSLICSEQLLRDEQGNTPSLEEYQHRFPQLSEALRIQWELDQLLKGSVASDLEDGSVEREGVHETILDGWGRRHKSPSIASLTRYEIREKIGQGSIGVVYEAWDSQLRRSVALKRLKAGLDAGPVELERMQSEAEAIARIRHANIVQIYDIGNEGGLPYIAMEFCRGGTLANRIEGKPLEIRQAVELVRQIASGVSAAHRNRIVHRDLKPNNILLSEDGGWEPKVTDFGLAKLLDDDSSATATGSILGTPAYMAPEQAFGEAKYAGPAADVYSIGAILYECLTGKPPFEANSIADMLDRVRNQVPASIRRQRPSVPRDLETIVMVCLRKEPFKRYADANKLEEDLSRFLVGEAIHAKEETVGEMTWRIVRRFPVASSLVAVSLTLLFAISIGSILVARRMNQLRLQAEQASQESDRKGQIAIEARNRAREALDSMTSGFASTFIREQREVTQEQKRFLRDVIAYYDELGNQDEGSISEVRSAANAAYRVGGIYHRLGEQESAIKHFSLAAARFRKLIGMSQTETSVEDWTNDVLGLSRALNGEGYAYRDIGDLTKAENCYWEAVHALEEVCSKFQSDPKVYESLAWLQHNIAVIYWGRNDQINNRKYLEQAYHTYLQISDRFPGYSGHNFNFAILEVSLGGVQSSPELACEKFLSARRKLRELLDSDPANSSYAVRLGWCLHSFANHLLSIRDIDRAKDYVEESIEVLEPLFERYSNDSGYKMELVEARICKARLEEAKGKFTESLQEYEKSQVEIEALAREHLESMVIQGTYSRIQVAVAQLCAKLGKYEDALDACQREIQACQRLKEHQAAQGKTFDYGLEYRILMTASFASGLDDRSEFDNWQLAEESCCRVWCTDGASWLLQYHRIWMLVRNVNGKLARGHIDEAIQKVDQWTTKEEWEKYAMHNFARCYSLISGALEEGDSRKLKMAERAMEFLYRMRDAGWLDWKSVAEDSDLKAISGRVDFQELVGNRSQSTSSVVTLQVEQ